MEKLLLLALVGLVAQLVDGTLGMAYGLSSATLLLAFGFAPTVISASVHAAELVTTFASGAAHWHFKNTDARTAAILAVPGAIGAFAGATVLASVDGAVARPMVSAILFGLGALLLFTLSRGRRPVTNRRPLSRRFLGPLGLVAGFIDATGGGGWGPVTTPALLAKGEAPNKTVGSVDTAEFAVAAAATLGFLLTSGPEVFNLPWVAALMAGGLVAAPVAAWLVSRMPHQLLGVLIAGVILLTNLRTLLSHFAAPTDVSFALYLLVLVAWGMGFWLMRRRQTGAALPDLAA